MKNLFLLLMVIFFSIRMNAQKDTTRPIQNILPGFSKNSVDSNTIILINNTVVGTIREIKKDLSTLFPQEIIDTILLIKGTEAYNLPRETGQKNVIRFILRKNSAPYKKEIIYSTTDGSNSRESWKKHLVRWINPFTPTENNAPRGKYTAIVQYRVDTAGFISEIIPLTNYGYGMEEQIIRAILRYTKLEPETYNGKPAIFYRKQPVTFFAE